MKLIYVLKFENKTKFNFLTKFIFINFLKTVAWLINIMN